MRSADIEGVSSSRVWTKYKGTSLPPGPHGNLHEEDEETCSLESQLVWIEQSAVFDAVSILSSRNCLYQGIELCSAKDNLVLRKL